MAIYSEVKCKMLTFFIVLSALSVVALIIGFVFVLLAKGETTFREGEEVGLEIMEGEQDDDSEIPIAEKAVFKGKAKSVGREASISFSEIKSEIRSGNWDQALPILLAVGGLLGLLFFGSIAVFLAIDNKMIGGLLAGIVIFTVFRIVYRLIKA